MKEETIVAMIIEIHKAELEILIRERMASGKFQNVEDALMQALQSSRPADAGDTKLRESKKPLGQFLLESPLRGSGLNLERQKHYPRPIDL